MKEPSVLDFLRSRLMPWKYPRIEIPDEGNIGEYSEDDSPPIQGSDNDHTFIASTDDVGLEAQLLSKPIMIKEFPWRSLLALCLAFAAQISMRPAPERNATLGVILLVLALGFLLWASLRLEWKITQAPPEDQEIDSFKIQNLYLLIGAILALFSFASYGNLRFTVFNLTLTFLSLGFIIAAFWVSPNQKSKWIEKLSEWLKAPRVSFSIKPQLILTVVVISMVTFFRFYRLSQVPPEMNSDHAEKIFDILDVLEGQTSIFFPNNGGREALQMYAVAALHRYFGIPLGFLALKIVTALVGFLSLPFLYLIGKEIGNRRVGLLAFVFAGISYWQNVVSRVGLRLPFYFLFTASTMYFILHGIRTKKLNSFIFAGISLGLSLYGYSADRILPLLIIVGIGLYLIHPQAKQQRTFVIAGLLVIILVSIVLFIPLLRYILAEPDSFLFRTLTRMANLERPLDAPGWVIFLSNTWRALLMFSWDAGEVWVISIPHYPALGIVSGGLFYMGFGLLVLRYLRKQDWLDIFLIISIPMLLLPSILALAFPYENPNLYRTAGASIPVFLIIAIALDGLMNTFQERFRNPWNTRFAWGIAFFLIGFSALQNYELVFHEYHDQYLQSSWNTSEIGTIAKDFANSIGTPDTIYVMGYPHWVDTRLVALNAGFPGKDYQLFVKDIQTTTSDERAKLFILNPQDTEAYEALKSTYPDGWFEQYRSRVESKSFLLFFAPPNKNDE
jgi:hypothetical protein